MELKRFISLAFFLQAFSTHGRPIDGQCAKGPQFPHQCEIGGKHSQCVRVNDKLTLLPDFVHRPDEQTRPNEACNGQQCGSYLS